MSSQLPTRIIRSAISGDFKQLADIGYKMNLSAEASADFVNKHFTNLNLLEWIQKVEKEFFGMATPPIDRKIYLLMDPEPKIMVRYHDSLYRDENLGLAFERTLMKRSNKISVSHDGFRIPAKNRGQGVSKKIFVPSIQEYVNMDIDHITVDAGLTHGGFVWAHYGFAGVKKSDMKTILDKAEEMLNGTDFDVVKKIYDSYYDNNREGDRFPIIKWVDLDYMKPVLLGTHWEGIIDFNNKLQLTNFISYAH